jgi:hypothetical protein
MAGKGAGARQGRQKIGTVPIFRRALLAALASIVCAPRVFAQVRGQITRIALSPDEFAKVIRDDYEAMAKVVKTVGRVE